MFQEGKTSKHNLVRCEQASKKYLSLSLTLLYSCDSNRTEKHRINPCYQMHSQLTKSSQLYCGNGFIILISSKEIGAQKTYLNPD